MSWNKHLFELQYDHFCFSHKFKLNSVGRFSCNLLCDIFSFSLVDSFKEHWHELIVELTACPWANWCLPRFSQPFIWWIRAVVFIFLSKIYSTIWSSLLFPLSVGVTLFTANILCKDSSRWQTWLSDACQNDKRAVTREGEKRRLQNTCRLKLKCSRRWSREATRLKDWKQHKENEILFDIECEYRTTEWQPRETNKITATILEKIYCFQHKTGTEI